MKLKNSISVALLLCSLSPAYAQFFVKPTYFETTDVSNQGVVVGYETWAGPYSLWNPDLSTLEVIGGLAPGNGIGGQARFSDDGNFVSGTSMGQQGPELSRYNRTAQAWTPLGSLGFSVDSTFSAGYCISGDGNTVVGNAWADTTGGHAYTNAVCWSQTQGIVQLGNQHANIFASARANAVNQDGSVIVGWQDFNGPWKSAVWRKQNSGVFVGPEYLLLDSLGSAIDEYNQLGECTAVSSDGNWVGGAGDFANNSEPWIWSAATGVINLGTLAPGAQGYVAGINADGSMAVGRFNLGPWDPQLPFIWTPSTGLLNLITYVNDTLGIATGSKRIYSANCLSADGRYVAGYGVDDSTFQYFTYRLTLPLMVGNAGSIKTEAVRLYPNPSANAVTIENKGTAKLTVSAIDGKVMQELTVHGNAVLDISAYPQGVYWIALESQQSKAVRHGKLVKQ